MEEENKRIMNVLSNLHGRVELLEKTLERLIADTQKNKKMMERIDPVRAGCGICGKSTTHGSFEVCMGPRC